MSKLYAVVTTVSGDRVRRASRVGADCARVDISTDNATYRLGVVDGEVYLLVIDKRWKAADATPESEWEELFVLSAEDDNGSDDDDSGYDTQPIKVGLTDSDNDD